MVRDGLWLTLVPNNTASETFYGLWFMVNLGAK
jgi:hypothetical protein